MEGDFNLGEEEVGELAGMIQGMLAGFTGPPCRIRVALMNENRDLALTLVVEEGLDPFDIPSDAFHCVVKTAFHEASLLQDTELMLAMVAKPETEWTERAIVTASQLINAPVEGRPSIPSLSSVAGNFFISGEGLSSLGLEVLMAYGYKLKERDFEGVCAGVAIDTSYMNMLNLCLASDCVAENVSFAKCLGLAIGGEHGSFVNGRHPGSVELVETLLKTGANPNGYCFQGETPYDSNPALYQAICNGDEATARLLIKYGADSSADAVASVFNDEEELDLTVTTIAEKAQEMEMTELLSEPIEVIVANPKAYKEELRREFNKVLKRLVADHSSLLVVAAMRTTGQVLPVGFASKIILNYCPLGFNLWKVEVE